jgi:hypothetical protein
MSSVDAIRYLYSRSQLVRAHLQVMIASSALKALLLINKPVEAQAEAECKAKLEALDAGYAKLGHDMTAYIDGVCEGTISASEIASCMLDFGDRVGVLTEELARV